MKLIRTYVRSVLKETTDKAFLDQVEKLWSEWKEVQEKIPTEEVTEEEYGYYWDEEKQDYEQDYHPVTKTVQLTQNEPKPSFTDENPKHYHRRHPAERRVVYGQTTSEIEIERKLMSLWQKHADIEFFKSEKLTYVHNVIYKSAARAMGNFGISVSQPKKSEWLHAQNAKQKDAISVSAQYSPSGDIKIGSQQMMSRGWGFVAEGWPIFASFSDSASQTQRMASDKARKYYKSSGLPKRASIGRASNREWDERQVRMRTRSLKRMKKLNDEEIKEWFRTHTNDVVINEQDIVERKQYTLDEVILDNWIIKAWYVSDIYQASKFFLEHLKSGNITKPIYIFDQSWNQSNNKHQVYDPENPKHIKKLLQIFSLEKTR